MTTSPLASPNRFATSEFRGRAPLVAFSVVLVVALAIFALLLALDPRSIDGQAAWSKPAKFAISIALYTATIAWMLGFVRSTRIWIRRFVTGFRWFVIGVLGLELVLIVVQVVRGTTSHFNVGASFDAALYSVMGTAITSLWFAHLGLALVLLFQRFQDPIVAWSVRFGVIIALIGMAQAFLMTSPTAQQMAALQGGAPATIIGAHSVGGTDTAPARMPITGWRMDAGDLRIGHFVGIHGLQILPLVGWMLRRRRGLTTVLRLRLLGLAAASYTALTALVTWQALRGQPLLQPDAWTLGSAAAWIIAASAVTAYWRTRPYPNNRPAGA